MLAMQILYGIAQSIEREKNNTNHSQTGITLQ